MQIGKMGLIVMASLCSGGLASAQTVDTPNFDECVSQHNDRLRLTCFDNAAGYTAPEEVASPGRPWTFFEDVDLMTDADTSFVQLSATTANNGNDSPGTIIIRCNRDGGSEVFVSTSGYIGDRRNRVPVTYRWNDEDPITESWNSSTSGQAAFLPSEYRDFLAGLTQGGTLAFEWEDFRGGRYASIWNDVELDENAQFILGGCR